MRLFRRREVSAASGWEPRRIRLPELGLFEDSRSCRGRRDCACTSRAGRRCPCLSNSGRSASIERARRRNFGIPAMRRTAARAACARPTPSSPGWHRQQCGEGTRRELDLRQRSHRRHRQRAQRQSDAIVRASCRSRGMNGAERSSSDLRREWSVDATGMRAPPGASRRGRAQVMTASCKVSQLAEQQAPTMAIPRGLLSSEAASVPSASGSRKQSGNRGNHDRPERSTRMRRWPPRAACAQTFASSAEVDHHDPLVFT